MGQVASALLQRSGQNWPYWSDGLAGRGANSPSGPTSVLGAISSCERKHRSSQDLTHPHAFRCGSTILLTGLGTWAHMLCRVNAGCLRPAFGHGSTVTALETSSKVREADFQRALRKGWRGVNHGVKPQRARVAQT